MLPRYVIAVVLAGTVTFGLFYLMHILISAEWEKEDPIGGKVIDFVRLKKEEETEIKKREKPDRTPPEKPPPPPDLNLSHARPDQAMEGIAFGFGSDVEIGGPGAGGISGDTEEVPLVRVEPQYPVQAAQRGIEGWVIVQFDITEIGTVKDPVIVDSSSTVFHRSALRAVRKWRYNPKVVDGKPVEVTGVVTRLTFKLKKT